MSESAQLAVFFNKQIMRNVPLTADVLTIGASLENDLHLPHPYVSRRHAKVQITAQGAFLTDTGSAGGTLLHNAKSEEANERWIQPLHPYPLAHGDSITIGPFELIYRSEQDTQTPDSQPSAHVPPLYPPPSRTVPSPRLRKSARYLEHLPVVFHDNDFFNRYLQLFEAIWEPLEQRQDQIALYFDATTCPTSLLPLLAHWLGIPISSRCSEEQLRQLLSEGSDLCRARGTKRALQRIIEICTGLIPDIRDESGKEFVIHISITAASNTIDVTLLEELIQAYKPAHVGYFLTINP